MRATHKTEMFQLKNKITGILGILTTCMAVALAHSVCASGDDARMFTIKPQLEVAASIQVGDTIEFAVEEGSSSGIASVEFISEVAGDKENATLFEWGWILNPFLSTSNEPTPSASQNPGSFHFSASPVKSGQITLPKLVLKNSKGEVVGQTQEWKADVISALNAQDKAAEMRPPAAVAVPVGTLLGIVALLLAILAIAYFVIRKLLKNKIRPEKEAKKEVILPEHEEALKALDALMEKRYYEKFLFKQHYFGISEILKHYVARRYNFNAEEKTSRELLRHMEIEIGIKDQILDDLETLFEKLDWVKFTDHVPDSLEALQLLNQTRDWVKRTQAQPQVSAGAIK